VVRPERLRLSSPDDIGSADNHAPAVITDIAYLGPFRRVALRYRDGSAGLLRESIDTATPFTPGDEVTVTWDPGQSVVVTGPSEVA
jgi:ABC-type Fe3+/spermidine/putrescine transport system ATPase subunit